MFGVPALRSEDPRFLRGEGRYLDNVEIPGALNAVFVRSIMPHARIHGLDVTGCLASPGVVGAYTARDLELAPLPPSGTVEGAADGELEGLFSREPIAHDVVRFVGEILAVVVAETVGEAIDAAELAAVEYEPLAIVVDPEAAIADGAPLLWPEFGTNVAHAFGVTGPADPLAGADAVVRGRFVNQRVAPAPLETNGIAVVPEGDGSFTVWVSTQIPFDVRDDLAETLGVGRDRVRAIAPDVGGAFGAKLQVYAEYHAVAAIAARLGRPVRWQETRSESMVSLTHGRAQIQTVELGATRDGTLVGLRAELLADMGAYPIGAFMPGTTQEMLSGVYRIPRIASSGRSVVTNTTPVAPYRGAGRPEATALVERAMDLLAVELGIDPVDLRRRNLIRPDEFPFTTVTGVTYDTGDYERPLDEALRSVAYDDLRAEQAARRARGDEVCLGIGVAMYVEITAFGGREFSAVEIGPDARVTVAVGTTPAGHGHETSFAQLASTSLGVPFEDVTVVHSDTRLVARGEGTWGSRSLQIGGSSVYEQAEAVVETGRRTAAAMLEVDAEDVERVEGGFAVAGAPDRSVSWSEVVVATDDGAVHAEGRFRAARIDVPVRRARGGRGGGHRDRGRAAAPPRRRGRLRPHPQSGARPRAAARRARAGDRAGVVRGGAVRRERQPDDVHTRDVPDAERRGPSCVRGVEHGDADRPEPLGGERDRRVGDDRVDARGAERRDGCALPPRRAAHRSSAHVGTRLAGTPGCERWLMARNR